MSIHHSERQKSQGNTAIFDAIDNLHTLITKCFVNRYGTELLVMGVCKIKSANNSPTDMEKAGRKSKAKNKTSAHPSVSESLDFKGYSGVLAHQSLCSPYHLCNYCLNVPADFDTIEKAFSGVKITEKGIKQGLSRSNADFESPCLLYSVIDFCRSKVRRHRGV